MDFENFLYLVLYHFSLASGSGKCKLVSPEFAIENGYDVLTHVTYSQLINFLNYMFWFQKLRICSLHLFLLGNFLLLDFAELQNFSQKEVRTHTDVHYLID